MIALLEAYHAHVLGRNTWLRNTLAGLIVGVVALPLAMAFAIASGVRPENGLYTAIVAGLCVSIFGGSRVQIAGPTGAFVVVLAGITAKYGILGLQCATMMAGIILVLLGLLRCGSWIALLPTPVVTGFTTAIGLSIWIGEWKDFFGLPAASAVHVTDKFLAACRAFPHLDLTTTLLASVCLLFLLLLPRLPLIREIPAPVTVLCLATFAQATWHFAGVATLGTAFGGLPHHLPGFALPHTSWPQLRELLWPACSIALLGAIESLLSAVVADRLAGITHDSNQELIGQGLANIASPLFGGIAATGAIARTATNIKHGATNPLAGIVHAVTVLLILLVLAPWAVHVPIAALAAILFVVAYHMSDVPQFGRTLWHASHVDRAMLLTTFVCTIFTDLVIGVSAGIVVALFSRRWQKTS